MRSIRIAWRILLVLVPLYFGQNNVKIGGDFLPGFMAGLLLFTVPLLLIEFVVRFFIRRARKPAQPA